MRAWGVPLVEAVAAIAGGCADSSSTDILATDGPNQVVLKVPGMT